MSDARTSDDPAARVALNARIAPELRRRLQLAVRERSATVQDVVEAQLTALLDSIDVAGIRAGTATAPGRATNPRGAETVPLNVRIRVPLAARIDALVAAVAGTTRQGLVIEALEALGEPGTTSDDLWAVISGASEPANITGKPAGKPASKKASKPANPKTPAKAAAKTPAKSAAKSPAAGESKKATARKAATPKAASTAPAAAPAAAAEAAPKPRRPLTAVGMLG